jgi:predicted HicB family RNase H-like nuclease
MGKGKKRLNIYIDEEMADAIQKFAALNGISQGELVEQAIKSAWSAPLGAGTFRLRKR